MNKPTSQIMIEQMGITRAELADLLEQPIFEVEYETRRKAYMARQELKGALEMLAKDVATASKDLAEGRLVRSPLESSVVGRIAALSAELRTLEDVVAQLAQARGARG